MAIKARPSVWAINVRTHGKQNTSMMLLWDSSSILAKTQVIVLCCSRLNADI